ncbi:MAG: type II toxin-antitoxin system HicA family toxin [bacterium]
MSKQPVMNAKEAEQVLLRAGFVLIRTKGSHRIYQKQDARIIIPFHGKKDLHPKIVKQVIEVTE